MIISATDNQNARAERTPNLCNLNSLLEGNNVVSTEVIWRTFFVVIVVVVRTPPSSLLVKENSFSQGIYSLGKFCPCETSGHAKREKDRLLYVILLRIFIVRQKH